MIACKHCQSQNGLDAKFCKTCGLALPEEDIKEATAKHDQLISEGYALFNAGRTDEALAIANAAVEEGATANALSLLGLCLERSGQLSEALECFERVLAINPDSALDRIKVTQLRTSLTSHMQAPPPNSRRTALIAAVCVVVLILSAGGIMAFSGSHRTLAQAEQSPIKVDEKGFVPDTVQATMNGPQSAVTKPADTPAPKSVTPTSEVLPSAEESNRRITEAPSTRDPEPQSAADLSAGPIPFQPKVPPGIDPKSVKVEPTPVATTAAPANSDPTPKVDAATAEAPAAKEDDPGLIDIRVLRPGTSSSDQGSSANELEALLRTAREEMMIGRHQSAARSYERALSLGGNQGMINQRLGMCYEKLGRSSDAVNAYSRAASAYQEQLDSGRGDSRRLKSGLESCKQAIRLLKG